MHILLVLVIACSWTAPAWAKTLKVPKGSINATQLHDDLLDRFPEWRGREQPNGTFTDPLLRVEYSDEEITLTVPDDANESTVRSVVASHVPGRRANHVGGRARALRPLTLEERVRQLEATLGLQE